MAIPTLAASCRFGPYELDLRTGDLSRGGRHLRLQEKPRCLLLALAERAGETVTRTELHAKLWPEDTFVDFEDGLNTAMRKLRETLGDDPRSPRYIETVRGRGYRLLVKLDRAAPGEGTDNTDDVGEVSNAKSAEAASALDPALPDGMKFLPADEPAVANRRAWTRALGAVLLAACGIAAVSIATRWRPQSEKISVIVLPFVNMTGDAAQNYLSNGMTEELIARLGSMKPDGLGVIAPASAMSFTGTDETAKQIGRELHVQYVIQGSLQQQGASLRVVAQLIRTKDQARVWAHSYDGDASDLLEFENSVADSVVQAMALKLPPTTPSTYQPSRYEAHDAYLQGLYFLSLRSKSGFERAMESFGRAVAADPKYADAYARLSVTYNLMGQYSWMAADNARSQGRAAAQQALSLDPTQAEAHAALGFSSWYYEWDAAAAEKELRMAVELAPQNVDAHHWYAQMLMTARRFPEAEEQMRLALELDPRSPILRTNLGWLHYYEGRFPQAIAEIDQVVKENNGFLTAHYKLWYAYSVTGDQAKAWREFQFVASSIADPAHTARIAQSYAASGYTAALKELPGPDSAYYGSQVDAARCMIFAGDRASAIAHLESAFQNHEGWMMFAAADPAFEPLQNDARFRSLMDSMKLRG